MIAREKPEATIGVEEMERRREALRRADAHNRIEGLYPSPETTVVYEQFIRGEIDWSEVRPGIDALHPRRS